jgi:hypothetical protein
MDASTIESFWIPRRERNVLVSVFGFACLWLLTLCLLPHGRWVDYLSDDAYYYLKVARNIALGNGPSFDGLTVTTGFHPLFAFILSGFQKILPMTPEALPRAMLMFNSAGCLATGFFIWSTLHQLWGKRTATWGAIFWYSNPHALLMVSTGMEGSLYACLLAACFAAFSRVYTSNHPIGISGVLGLAVLNGLAILTRTDGILLALLTAAAICIPSFLKFFQPPKTDFNKLLPESGRALGKALFFLLLALIPFLLWLRYAEQHTGTFLQSSARVKGLWRAEEMEGLRLLGQIGYSLDIFWTWIVKSIVKVPPLKFLLPFSAAFALSIRLKPLHVRLGFLQILWVFPLLLGAAYSLKFSKAWTWYYVPGLVGLTLMAAGCLHYARAYTGKGKLHTYAKRWIPFLLIFSLVESYGYLGLKSIRGRNKGQRDMYAVAVWIDGNIPETATLAAWNSGVYGWVGDRILLNLDGLINNEIYEWQLTGQSESDYIRQRNIDYIVDRTPYMARSLPDWEEGVDYTLLHHHSSTTESDPVQIWKVIKYP